MTDNRGDMGMEDNSEITQRFRHHLPSHHIRLNEVGGPLKADGSAGGDHDFLAGFEQTGF